MAYPTVNYIGNKEKIVTWITSLIPEDVSSLLDVFCGGCSVSYAAKEKGISVFSNDILAINHYIGKALIENESTILTQEDVNRIFEGDPFEGFMYKNYANKFYFPDECMQLDLYRKNVLELDDEYKRALAFILLRRAMIRKMPYSRFTIRWDKICQLRDEQFSYEHYKRPRSYHNKSFRFHFEDNLAEYNAAVFSNGKKNHALNLDVYEAIDSVEADAIYLDPPYAGTMNDYFGFYGLLDSYINGKVAEPFDNNFIDRKTIIEQFDRLFGSLAKYKYWMLSYNSRSNPSKDELLELIHKYADNVVVHEMPYAYRVTGKEKKNKDIEYLFVVKTR